MKSLGFRSSVNPSLSRLFPICFNGLLWLLLCGLLLCEPAVAATPDLGSQELLRQQEREQYLRNEQEQAPDVRLPAVTVPESITRLPDTESPCFPISHIVLTGELADHFQFALESATEKGDVAIGRCLGTQGINIVLTRIQNALIAEGYVTTRVLVAPQDLKSGTLYLTIIPGRIHAIRFSPDSSPRGRYENALPLHKGDLLNLRDIEQGLENIKRVPTAEVDIKIAPATGSIQGWKGTLFGIPYAAKSWQDKLIESFGGTHDVIGDQLSGLYDEQGNAIRGRPNAVIIAQNT